MRVSGYCSAFSGTSVRVQTARSRSMAWICSKWAATQDRAGVKMNRDAAVKAQTAGEEVAGRDHDRASTG
jgi:hypothetical protein